MLHKIMSEEMTDKSETVYQHLRKVSSPVWEFKKLKIKLKINLIDATFLKICIDIVIILLALFILTMIMRTENQILWQPQV